MRMTNQKRLILLGGNHSPYPGSSSHTDFTKGQVWIGSRKSTLAQEFQNVNSTGGTVTYASGQVVSVAANTLRVSDQGLLVELATTNLVPTPVGVGGVGWTLNNAPTFTANNLAPDGTLTAAQFVVTSSATTGAFLGSGAGPTLLAATTYTSSGWFKWVSGGTTAQFTVANQNAFGGVGGDRSVTFNMQTAAFVAKSTEVSSFTLTLYPNGWVRVTGTFTTTTITSPSSTAFYVAGSPSIGSTFQAWGSQIEALSFPTSLCLTGSRSADAVTALDGAMSQLMANPFSVRVQSFGSAYNSGCLIGWGSAGTTGIRGNSPTTGIVFGPSNNVAFTLGGGGWGGVVRTVASVSGNASAPASAVANNGAVASGTLTTFSQATPVTIGATGAGTLPVNGYLQQLTTWAYALPTSQMSLYSSQ